MMESLKTAAMVLLVLLVLPVSVSSSEVFFTHTIICYFLDLFLFLYCIFFTVIYFREKHMKDVADSKSENSRIYQELRRSSNPDPYQVLEPSKRKKKRGRKVVLQSKPAEHRNPDVFETLTPPDSASAPVTP